MELLNGIESRVLVKTRTSQYDVLIGRGFLTDLCQFMETVVEKRNERAPDKVFLITDDNVWPLYKDVVLPSFDLHDNRCDDEGIINSANWRRQDDKGYSDRFNAFFNVIVFPAGERSKNPSVLVQCLEAMAQAGLTRDSIVVTLGGGVVCDLGGFAAATYMRGIRVLQVPTSLLAMVDASVGGKTAVDLQAGKNLFGAFHQPIAVLIDIDVLKTLSDEQFRDSVGEIVKHSILADVDLFNFLSENKLTKQSYAFKHFSGIVKRNVEIKRDIVNADECERGVRQTLNLGHTVGHAIEAASGYSLGHGTCVAAGLCTLTSACAKAGITPQNVSRRIIQAYETQGIVTTTDVPVDVLMHYIMSDKKRHGNTVNVVVVNEIANCVVRRFTFDELKALLS